MSQSFNTPAASDNLADARTKTETSLKAVDSDHSGSSAPTSPVAFRRWVDSVNNWLWRRNPGNTAWQPVMPVDGRGGPVIYLAKFVVHTNAGTPVTVGYLPANYRVIAAYVFVDTVVSGSSTATISVGYSGAQTIYVNAADVTTNGRKTGAGIGLDSKSASARTITALLTTSGGTASGGKCEVIVQAVIGEATP